MSRFDVYVSRLTSALKPSKTQQRLLDELKDGARLIGRFHVWGGYDWLLCRENGMTSSVQPRTIQGLLDRGLIVKGEAVSVYSGRQETPFTLPTVSQPK